MPHLAHELALKLVEELQVEQVHKPTCTLTRTCRLLTASARCDLILVPPRALFPYNQQNQHKSTSNTACQRRTWLTNLRSNLSRNFQ
jgi:hypothetical protein